MGIIDHERGFMPAAGTHQPRNIGYITVHAENAVGEHERISPRSGCQF